MRANDLIVGQKFKHRNGAIILVIEEGFQKLLEIEDCGTFEYIDDDFIEYEL